MSGIPGIFERDGRPASLELLQHMADASAHRGPDGVHCMIDGPVAMGHQHLFLLYSDAVERQPLVLKDARLAIVMDGRIDNRGELLAALGLDAASISDAALVLRAYERWGETSAGRLLGDFAFVIWDRPRQRLFCARDAMGVKPFYYHAAPGRFVWASELAQVLAAGVPREPNEGMVAEHLARSIHRRDETLFRGVMRLPPAHSMTVTSTSIRIERYWRLDPSVDLRCRSDDEYAERFRAIFEDAVVCRMRTDYPVGAHLSGGVDSSSVVGVARARGCDLETFSLVVGGDRFADESAYIDAVTRRWQIRGHILPAAPVDPRMCRARTARRADVPDLPSDLAGQALLEAMRESGRRVILTGVGGDYGFGGTLYHYADLLAAGNLSGFVRQVWADAQVSDVGWEPSQIFWTGIRPLIPAAMRRAARPLARRFGWTPQLPRWIAPAFAMRVGLSDRMAVPPDVPRAGAFSRRQICESFASGWPYRLLETADRFAAEYGLEERHPFFDRRVVEFAVAIPESQRWQGRRTKFVVRNALSDVLPPEVANRTDKGDYAGLVVNAVNGLGGAAFFAQLEIAAAGWIDPGEVRAMYAAAVKARTRGDESYVELMLNLWMIAGVELWFDQMFLKGSRDARSTRHEEVAAAGGTGPSPKALLAAGTH